MRGADCESGDKYGPRYDFTIATLNVPDDNKQRISPLKRLIYPLSQAPSSDAEYDYYEDRFINC
jgi:hypothetical protein